MWYIFSMAITYRLLSNMKRSDYAKVGLESKGNLDSGDWVFIIGINLIILMLPMVWLGIF